MSFKIIEENAEYLTVWKKQGIPTTTNKNNGNAVIIDIVKKRPELKNVIGYRKNEFGLLNRLDNDTGGIIIIAKSNEAFQKLKEKMNNNKICKIYLAYCYNKGSQKKGVVKFPIAHHKKNKKKMVVLNNKKKFKYRGKPQPAQTEYEIINPKQAEQIWKFHLNNKVDFPCFHKENNTYNYSWVLCKIKKGKRHQIRLHLYSINYPIIGDKLYFKEEYITNTDFEKDYHKLFSIGIKIEDYSSI